MKTNKAFWVILSLLICICIFLSGCTSASTGNYPATTGHTKFTESPVKVVSLSDNIADILCYMGYASKLGGVSDACTQKEIQQYITSVGSEETPNTDLIVSSGATVVFADSTLDEASQKVLEDNNIEVMKFIYPKNDEQLKGLYRTIGTILGGKIDGSEKGLNTYDRLISILNTARDEVASVSATKTVCYLYINSNGILCACTGKTNDGMVLNYLGATNVAANFDKGYVDENILKLSNPDYIFFNDSAVMEKLTSSAKLKELSALKKGNVFELKYDELCRQGESIVGVQSFMLSSMFPNLVEAPKEEVEDISKLYGITLKEDMAFKNGDDNENIIAIQQRLVDLGFLDLGEDSPTTYFGSMSEEALKAFQSANGLEASGMASYETLKKLFSSDAVGKNGETFVPEETVPATEAATTTAETTSASEEATTAPAEEEPTTQSSNANTPSDTPITITDSTSYQSGDEHEDIRAIQTRLVELLYLSFDEGDSPTTYYGPGTENAIRSFQESNGLSATGVADADTLRVLFSSDAKIPQ